MVYEFAVSDFVYACVERFKALLEGLVGGHFDGVSLYCIELRMHW